MKQKLLAGLLSAAMIFTMISPYDAMAKDESNGSLDKGVALTVEDACLQAPELRDTLQYEIEETDPREEALEAVDDLEALEQGSEEVLIGYTDDGEALFLDPEDDQVYLGTTIENYTELQQMIYYNNKIREALLSGKTGTINISLESTLNKDQVEQFYHMGYFCPYTDGSKLKVVLPYYSTGNYAYISVINSMSASETIAWVNLIDEKVNELLELVSDASISVADQVLILHDYMDSHYYYDTTYADYYPSIMLTEKSGVCQSYAYLFQYLMGLKGVECYTTVSDSMNHAWNIVGLNGNYYNLDITWDDPIQDYFGQARHNYFMLSDATMQDSNHNHSGRDLTQYACNDTSFEDDYLVNSVSPVVVSGNDRYYINASSGLIRYSIADASTTLLDGAGKWYVWGSTSRYWSNHFSGLFSYGGKLYYNTEAAVKTYDLSSGTVATYANINTSSGYIYGIVDEGSTLYYEYAQKYGTNYTSKDIRSLALPSAHVHNYTSTLTVAAGCETKGVRTYTCAGCGDSYTEEIASLGGHHYAGVVTLAAACETAGVKTFTCSVCGDCYTEAIASLGGHIWDNGVVTKEATTTEEGIMTFTCTRDNCGATRTEAIAKLEEVKPTASIVVTKGTSSRKLRFIGYYNEYGTDAFNVTAHGIVYMTVNKLANRELTINTSGRTKVSFGAYKDDGSFIYNITGSSVTAKYAVRAFITFVNAAGQEETIYSDMWTGCYNDVK